VSHKQIKKKTSVVSWVFLGLLVILLGAAVYVVKSVLSDDSPRKKISITTVNLLKPPPPPQIKEKPPEPEPPKEIPKKEEIIAPGPKDESPTPQNKQDNTPAGNKLGLDTEGTAGSDAFGLVGNKGGRSITLGGSGGGGGLGQLSLLSKFGGYAHIAEAEIRKKVMKRLEEEGGMPKGRLEAVARIRLDRNGEVIECRIVGSSGNHNMDDAINQALDHMKISEPPPDGMPLKMDIKFSYQG
jgi:TonB family protein